MDQITDLIKKMGYKFEGELPHSKVDKLEMVQKPKTKIDLEKTLYAQPTDNGFQLVDSTPQLVMKLFKTSQPDFYTAQFQNQTGMVFKRDNQWFFEFTQEGTLKTVPLTIKF
jgi:hypothetical protein